MSDKPNDSVRVDIARTVTNIVATNASGDFALAAYLKTGSRKALPPKKIIPNATAAFPAAVPNALRRLEKSPPPTAKSGTTTRRGTTARSWNKSIPNEARPNRVPTSPLSESN